MLYPVLESFVATQNDLSFKFGPVDRLNKEVDDSTGPVLYHEGYMTADVSIDGQGAFVYSYPLRLWLFIPSEHEATSTQKRIDLTGFYPVRDRLMVHLKKAGRLTGIRIVDYGIINATDRQFAGISLNATLTFDPIKICL